MAMSHLRMTTGQCQVRPCGLSAPRAVPAVSMRSIARAEATSSTLVNKVAAVSAASTLMLANSAVAAQESSQLAASDNRLLIIATVFLPVVGWVGFNIAGPALNQIANIQAKQTEGKAAIRGGKKKRSVVGPLAGLSAAGLMMTAQHADAAQEVMSNMAGDTRVGILAALFLPAAGWVAFNIGGPALNQIANITSKREGGLKLSKGRK